MNLQRKRLWKWDCQRSSPRMKTLVFNTRAYKRYLGPFWRSKGDRGNRIIFGHLSCLKRTGFVACYKVFFFASNLTQHSSAWKRVMMDFYTWILRDRHFGMFSLINHPTYLKLFRYFLPSESNYHNFGILSCHCGFKLGYCKITEKRTGAHLLFILFTPREPSNPNRELCCCWLCKKPNLPPGSPQFGIGGPKTRNNKSYKSRYLGSNSSREGLALFALLWY